MYMNSQHGSSHQWRLQGYVFPTDKIFFFLQFIPYWKAGSVTARLLFFAGECCLCGKMLLAPWVTMLQKQCGALFAELLAMPSSAEHPCPALSTFISLNVLEPIPWRDNVLPSNLENTGMQWAHEYDRSAVWSRCFFCSISCHMLLTQVAQTFQRIPYSCWFLFLVCFIGLLHC